MTSSNNDDFIDNPGLDVDSDFSEFDTIDNRSGAAGGAWKNNPMVKIGLVVGAFAAIIGSIILFGGSEEKAPPSVVPSGQSDLKATPGEDKLNDAMVDAYKELNQERQEDAIRTGGSMIPVPIDPPQERVELQSEQAAAEDPLNVWRRMQEERLRTQQQQQAAVAEDPKKQAAETARNQAVQSLAQAMSNQMSQILATKQIRNLKQMTVTDPKLLEEQRKQELLEAQTAGNVDAVPQTVNVIIPAGTVEYAQLLIEANSDVEGPVVALVVTGPYAGSRILGSFEREADYLVISFNVLVKDGISVPVKAIALDPDTTLPALATEVDHRYFQRVILPAAAKFVEGMGSAIAETGGSNTSVSVNDTTVVEDESEEPDTREEFYKGVEEAAGKVSELLDDQASEVETLVIVKAGTPMGILFTLPVTDKDVTLGKQGKTHQDQEEENNNSLLPSSVTTSPRAQQLMQTLSGDKK